MRRRWYERVLDLGCGTGRYLQRLASAGARPVGADFSLGMLRAARRRVDAVPLVAADLQQDFPFDDATFDATVCALVGEHLERLHITLREAHRALRPGGRLVFTVYHPDLAAAGKEANFVRDGVEYRLGAVRWSTGQYVDRLTGAGFTDIETWEFPGDEALAALVPGAHHLHGSNVLLALRARRPA